MSLFDEIISSKQYQDLLNELPDDERKVVLESLRELVDGFEKGIIEPIEKLHNG